MNYWVEQNVKRFKLYKTGDFVYWRKSKYLKNWSQIVALYGSKPMMVRQIYWSFIYKEICLLLELENGITISEVHMESICLVQNDFEAI